MDEFDVGDEGIISSVAATASSCSLRRRGNRVFAGRRPVLTGNRVLLLLTAGFTYGDDETAEDEFGRGYTFESSRCRWTYALKLKAVERDGGGGS